jgi:hypothetical protein
MAVVAVVVAVATYLTWTASRVDRLHGRAQAARSALDTHLAHRARAAVTVGEAGACPQLAAAARAALQAGSDEREAAENDLTRQLRAHLADTGDRTRPDELVGLSRRVALARQVHSDVVRDALAARRRIPVRVLGLARRHDPPAYFDVDDPALEPALEPALDPVPTQTRGPVKATPPITRS